MAEVAEDPAREERIGMEAIVDAYGAEERSLGWYCYLDAKLAFPFRAECISKRTTSPLKVSEKVEVISMAPEEECERDMFVIVKWRGEELGVPLAQLKGIKLDEDSEEAIADWHYWVARGYEF